MNLLEETTNIFNSIGKSWEDISQMYIETTDAFYDFDVPENTDMVIVAISKFNVEAVFTVQVKLNINYDDDFGSQEIEGWISFNDGSWIERSEYDGSEWWEYREMPTLEK